MPQRPDYHVIAWNFVDDDGRPIVEIDEDMTRAEYKARVAGKFACENTMLLRAISREVIDAALAREFRPGKA